MESLLNGSCGTKASAYHPPPTHRRVCTTCTQVSLRVNLLDKSSPGVDLRFRVFQLRIPFQLLSQLNLHAKSLDCCLHYSIRSSRAQKRWLQYSSASDAYGPAIDIFPLAYLLPLSIVDPSCLSERIRVASRASIHGISPGVIAPDARP